MNEPSEKSSYYDLIIPMLKNLRIEELERLLVIAETRLAELK
jgi:hypothetical protein